MNSLLKCDGPRLDELLERVHRELGPDVSIVEANRSRRGGIGGFFAKEWFEVVVEIDVDADATGSAVDAPAPADALLAMALAVDDVRETRPPEPGRVDAPQFALALAAAQRESVALAVPELHAATANAAPRQRPVPPPRTRRLRDLDLAELLGHLDGLVPAALLPTAAAATIAVVGDPSTVRRVATALASRMGLDEADVVIASPGGAPDVAPWLVVSTPEQVAARTVRWRSSGRPTVVAVELSPGREGHAWSAAMLDALEADQVRLVAKAWQLTDQLATKALALGGIDGIDLVEVDAAAEPELFLELDLPVLGIDGRPATAELWAAVLFERRHDDHDQ